MGGRQTSADASPVLRPGPSSRVDPLCPRPGLLQCLGPGVGESGHTCAAPLPPRDKPLRTGAWVNPGRQKGLLPWGRLGRAGWAVAGASAGPGSQGQCASRRYILIDWLVEVATMKDFSSLCLHLTVECVDRYLRRRLVPRYRLQLLGIACMVICTR